jgi:hypothetical protein
MSRDLKNPQPFARTAAADAGDSGDSRSSADVADATVGSAPRLMYKAPLLKRLGSVRDLTLGSPPGKAGDGLGGKKTM